MDINSESTEFGFYGIAIPVLSFVGLVANAADILVFSQRSKSKRPAYRLFLAASLVDVLTIAATVSMLSIGNWAFYFEWKKIMCANGMITVIAVPIAYTAQTTSVLLTLFLTTTKFIGVVFPLHLKRIVTNKTVNFGIAFAFISSICLNFPKFFEFKLESGYISYKLDSTCYFFVPENRIGHNQFYILYYRGVFETSVLILLFAAIAILNIVTTFVLRNSGNQQSLGRSQAMLRGENRTTAMLVTYTFLFLFTNFPAVVCNILDTIIFRGTQNVQQLEINFAVQMRIVRKSSSAIQQSLLDYERDWVSEKELLHSFDYNFHVLNETVYKCNDSVPDTHMNLFTNLTTVVYRIWKFREGLCKYNTKSSDNNCAGIKARDNFQSIFDSAIQTVKNFDRTLGRFQMSIEQIYFDIAASPALRDAYQLSIYMANLLVSAYCSLNTLVFLLLSKEYRTSLKKLCGKFKLKRSQAGLIVSRL